MPQPKKPAAKPAMLSRDQILDLDDRKTEIVPVPEWGGAVKVQSFTVAKALEWAESEHDDAQFILLHGVVEPQFTPDDIPALMQKSMVAVNRIVEAANRLNDTGQGAVAQAERQFPAGASE